MKALLRLFQFIFGYGYLGLTTAFCQTTFTWTGAGDGTNIASAANWSPAGGPPNGYTQDTGRWDGVVPGNLVIACTSISGLPGTGFGSQGVNWNLTPNQVGSVALVCPGGFSQNVPFYNINVAAGAGALALGDDTTNFLDRQLNLIARPAAFSHALVNNSTNPATINACVRWQAGGGSAYVLDFDGTGNWVVNNFLRTSGGSVTVTKNDSGTMTWTAAGFKGNDIIGPVYINGGTLILKSPGLVPTFSTAPPGHNVISNNATLVFDAPSQSDVISRAIGGSGQLQMNNGTLTLSGANNYTGSTSINGGVLVINSVGGDLNAVGGTLVSGGVGSVNPASVAGNLNILSGTVVIALNKSFSPSNTTFVVAGTVNCTGGTLKVLNFGPALQIGDKFSIFGQAVGGGAGMMVVSPGCVLANNLAADGSVMVTSVSSLPVSVAAALSGGNLNLTWPPAWAGLHLQVQTNPLTIGLSNNWITIPGTDAGNSYAVPVNPATGCLFYRLAP